MQQVTGPSGTTVVVLAQPAIQRKQELYRNMKHGFSRALIGLGAVQLSIGLLCIIFQCVSVGFYSTVFSLAFVGHGIWNGLLFLITGIFGIMGGCRKSRCEVVSFNVFSLISACYSTALLGIATTSAIVTNCQYSRRSYYYSTTTSAETYNICWDLKNVVISMESMLAILAFIEGIVAIVSSAYCCAIGACCCRCDGCCCCCPEPPPQPQFPAAVGEHSYQQNFQQPTPNQWAFSQNQPHHHVQPSDTSYQHRYDSLQNAGYSHIASAPSPTISDNHSYKEINYDTEQILPYN